MLVNRSSVGLGMRQAQHGDVLGRGDVFQLQATMGGKKSSEGLLGGRLHQGVALCRLNPSHPAQRSRKVGLQRGYGNPAIQARVDAVARVCAAHGTLGLSKPPTTGQG